MQVKTLSTPTESAQNTVVAVRARLLLSFLSPHQDKTSRKHKYKVLYCTSLDDLAQNNYSLVEWI